RRSSIAAVRYLTMSSGGVKGNDITYTASGINMYYPGVIVDGSGNMYMTYSRSSSKEYASMYQTGMTTSESAIESSALVKGGIGPITSGRWGDYSGASPDPSNSSAVWLYGGWANSSNRWSTWVAGASFNASLPKSAGSDGDAVAAKTSPLSFGLVGNYPNPFNPSTTIRYSLKEHASVHLTVYNALGQQVAELVNGEADAGTHDVRFDAAGLASGVYFYRLQAGGQTDTKRLVLAR
ncbi:MAG TPA: T9SS type A sorting domain-containing protein, partial [Bacteroidota bacterium]